MKIGYVLASEEFGPHALLDQARRAHDAGFHALWISDHYHPWNDEQGHSPFV
jgi:alkanesulfonate monooxygenase SsuD/methylene tetrahydromethanopterin reductase-like flavin-dependent oxidoreductase (luciferase family)